jgi:hypothetical protein
MHEILQQEIDGLAPAQALNLWGTNQKTVYF